jgi:hypothetical protein
MRQFGVTCSTYCTRDWKNEILCRYARKTWAMSSSTVIRKSPPADHHLPLAGGEALGEGGCVPNWLSNFDEQRLG